MKNIDAAARGKKRRNPPGVKRAARRGGIRALGLRAAAGAALWLCALLLAGCVGEGAGPAGAGDVPAALPPASGASPAQSAAAEAPAALSILLPAEKAAFGEGLAELAAADGTGLVVRSLPADADYGAAAAEALAGPAPPDILWLESAGDMPEAGGETPLYNLESADAGPVMQSLAGMVPPQTGAPAGGGLRGLPLGYYAEGYLVDLSLLQSLLGEPDAGTLLEDLYACDWQQWVTLVRGIESVLAEPGRIELTLGENEYATPTFRPAAAQPLRGIFAVPTADAAETVGSALELVVSLSFENEAELANMDSESKELLMKTVMPSLLGVLELETMHMTQATGPLRRGEGLAAEEALAAEDAAALFGEGRALFLRGSSALCARLEREYPALAGKLALVPVKLPPPSYLDEGGAEGAPSGASGDAASQEGDGEVIETTPLPQEAGGAENGANGEDAAGTMPTDAAAEIIRASNMGLWYRSDGLLCISGESEAKAQARSLLLRLYTTPAGLSLVRDGLGLYAFSTLYPEGQLARQVSAEVADGSWQLVAAPSALAEARAVLGGLLQNSLMREYHWDAALQAQFRNAGAAAIGALGG